jgi:3-hydroxyacyl-[acyl-carrier protein] dehydratase / trans-2-decenoyl-[acyl-carrier protein] isomerase
MTPEAGSIAPNPIDAWLPGRPLAAPRLPLPPFLGFDAVLDLSADGGRFGLGGATACKDVASLRWMFDRHFPGDPVVPGTWLLDALLQLTGLYAAFVGMAGRGRAARVGGVRFLREVTPDAGTLRYAVTIRRLHRAGQIVVADGEVLRDGSPCLSASGLCVAILAEEAGLAATG